MRLPHDAWCRGYGLVAERSARTAVAASDGRSLHRGSRAQRLRAVNRQEPLLERLPTITEELFQYAEHYFTIHLDHEPECRYGAHRWVKRARSHRPLF